MNTCFQIVHFVEMLSCDLFTPWAEPVDFRPEFIKLALILEKVKEQGGENRSGCIGSCVKV